MSYFYEYLFESEILEKKLLVEVEIINYHNPNYGADADGRRGVSADFPEVKKIKVYDGLNLIKDQKVIQEVNRDFRVFHLDQALDYAVQEYPY